MPVVPGPRFINGTLNHTVVVLGNVYEYRYHTQHFTWPVIVDLRNAQLRFSHTEQIQTCEIVFYKHLS